MLPSLIELTDGYKLDHRRQYRKGTRYVQSNFTPRGSRDPRFKKCIFMLLQGFLQEFLMEHAQQTFFQRPVDEVCDQYQDLLDDYFGPNDIGSDHIRALHQLGYIPLEFRALPEGTAVPLRVPMFTYENTHPDFFWVTNYFETLLSSYIWKPCRNATLAREYYRIMEKYALMTGADLNFLKWQCHDFSFRGMSGPEDAMRSGAAHAMTFSGSDTVPTRSYLKRYYDAQKGVIGSIPATEHAVMCVGEQCGELQTFNNLLDLYPRGPLSVVSDTWNLWDVVEKHLPALKPRIMERDGKLVVRPDSGDPESILCGDSSFALGTPERKGVVQGLWDIFLGSTTPKAFKVLDSHIGSVYGDSITLDRADRISNRLMHMGFASTNVVYGVGSYTYQYGTRDDFGMAVKATWALCGNEEILMQKDPITDKSGKKSAKGRLSVVKNEHGELMLVDGLTLAAQESIKFIDLLKPVWRDGQFLIRQSKDEISARIATNI